MPDHDRPGEAAAPCAIRAAVADDLPSIARIYGWHVEHGTGTFETEVPELAEMARRHAEITAKGLPWLVAESDGEVLGYAYANPFRPRLAYRYFLEDSIYMAPAAARRGIGRLLLTELIERCEQLGARQMIAVIGDSQNHGSIELHRALGFEPCGLMRASGWKFGRWLDVVLMQRSLGAGASEPAPQGH